MQAGLDGVSGGLVGGSKAGWHSCGARLTAEPRLSPLPHLCSGGHHITDQAFQCWNADCLSSGSAAGGKHTVIHAHSDAFHHKKSLSLQRHDCDVKQVVWLAVLDSVHCAGVQVTVGWGGAGMGLRADMDSAETCEPCLCLMQICRCTGSSISCFGLSCLLCPACFLLCIC